MLQECKTKVGFVTISVDSVWGCLRIPTEWQGLTFVSVCENQISLKLLHKLYDSMREIYQDVMRITARIESVILVESEALEWTQLLMFTQLGREGKTYI